MPEDRDQLFERALARHLRALGAGESLCPDPETLAAYHQRTLSPEELPSAKSHIVSCARCQEVLAQLEASEEVNELQEVPHEAPASAARVLPSGARRRLEESPARKPPAVLPPKKAFTLRWRAPAGAVAAVLLIWLVARDSREFHKPASEAATQVAENRPQLPSSPLRGEENELSLRKDRESGMAADLEKQRPAAGSAGGQKRAGAPVPSLLDERTDSAVQGKLEREKKPSLAYEYMVRNGAVTGGRGPSAGAAQAQANNALQRGDQSAAGSASRMVEITPAPGDLDQRQLQTPKAKSDALGTAEPPPPPSPSRDQSQPAGALKAKTADVSSAPITSAEAFKAPAFSPAVSKIGLDIRITAPSGNKIWNVGPGGQILHSTDAGRTWLLQISGVAANLIGGSAPSDKVCWIAGAAGTLLRSTDGGLHWQEIRTPIAGDLGGVHASDAKHAFVWDAANHLSFETSDGGKTWKQSRNE